MRLATRRTLHILTRRRHPEDFGGRHSADDQLRIVLQSQGDVRTLPPCGANLTARRYIKKTTEIIATKYNGVPPKTLEETLEFPGVGPKMAHLYLQIAHGVCVAPQRSDWSVCANS